MTLAPQHCPSVRTDTLPSHVTMALEIDLSAIVHNYHLTKSCVRSGCDIAGVVKADAYGLGMIPVAGTLWQEGCQHFFVAFVNEGIALRKVLPEAHIYVLSGILPHTEDVFLEYNLTPVLVDRDQIERWRLQAHQLGRLLPAILHVDTGMTRNGLSYREIMKLTQHNDRFQGLQLDYVMSHLASSEEIENPENEAQRNIFERMRSLLPVTKASLSNSSGITLGESYHFDLVRPGLGLLGYARPFPFAEQIRPAVKASARVVQLNDPPKGQPVGYNASYRCERASRLATLGLGYGDGFFWNLSNQGVVWFGTYPAPVVGRVSMDFVVVDVTDIPENHVFTGAWATLFDSYETVHQLSRQANTFNYELLTSLGSRYYRQYLKGKDKA